MFTIPHWKIAEIIDKLRVERSVVLMGWEEEEVIENTLDRITIDLANYFLSCKQVKSDLSFDKDKFYKACGY